MDVMGVADAAALLGVSPRRVHQMVASGQLDGRRIGRIWLLRDADVRREARMRRQAGRPWNASSAWNVLALANGDAPRGSPVERSRAAKRLSDGLESLGARLSSRARSHWFYAHPSVLAELVSQPGVVACGLSALSEHRVDLVVADRCEAYARSSQVAGLLERFALDADSDRPNAHLRAVADEHWPFGPDQRVAPAPVVAVDLLESEDERSRRAGRELLARP